MMTKKRKIFSIRLEAENYEQVLVMRAKYERLESKTISLNETINKIIDATKRDKIGEIK